MTTTTTPPTTSLKMQYREAVAAHAATPNYSQFNDELHQLAKSLGITDIEVERHVRASLELARWLADLSKLTAKKSLIPALTAERNAVRKRHNEIFPKSRKEELEREQELAEVESRLRSAWDAKAEINRVFTVIDGMLDDEHLAESARVRSDIERLQEQAAELSKKCRGETLVVPSHSGPEGAKKVIRMDEEYWAREAKFSGLPAEQRRAEDKLIELSRARRNLADVKSQIDQLTNVVAELESRPLSPQWFKM